MRVGSTTDGQFVFAQVPSVNVPRSTFDRSCGHKTTFSAGDLVPIYLDHIVPGDTVSLRMTSFARLATQRVPVMDNMYLECFFFFVPYRLLWDNFEKFMGQQTDPGDSTSYELPVAVTDGATGAAELSLEDYFGIPTKVPGLEYMNLPMRAYNLIWNEWFRDQNLQDSLVVDLDDGPDDPDDYVLVKRGKRHDYFTSCLPFPQKGDAVTIGIGSTAPVTADDDPWYVDSAGYAKYISSGGGSNQYLTVDGSNVVHHAGNAGNLGLIDENTLTIPTSALTFTADLSSATAVTINQLRLASSLQRILERDARGGTRYTEMVRSHFGVVSPDQRLQRPEFLGGGRWGVNVQSVPATAMLTLNVGDLAAYATAVGSGQGFAKSFTEHGLVIGMVSARADLNYQQGLERHWSNKTRYDLYMPSLAHLGEQAVLLKELWAVGTGGSTDDDVWGYQERWAHMRYKPSMITGLFRSNATQSLDIWHLAQEFATKPVLGDSFIQENPPIDRIVWDTAEPDFIFDSFFKVRHTRPMPTYSVPSLTDRF